MNIEQFPIDIAKTRVLPLENITFSSRNTLHKGVHRGIRGLRGPSVDDAVMTTFILHPVVIKPKSFVGKIRIAVGF